MQSICIFFSIFLYCVFFRAYVVFWVFVNTIYTFSFVFFKRFIISFFLFSVPFFSLQLLLRFSSSAHLFIVLKTYAQIRVHHNASSERSQEWMRIERIVALIFFSFLFTLFCPLSMFSVCQWHCMNVWMTSKRYWGVDNEMIILIVVNWKKKNHGK